jgi:hypothetical protein
VLVFFNAFAQLRLPGLLSGGSKSARFFNAFAQLRLPVLLSGGSKSARFFLT